MASELLVATRSADKLAEIRAITAVTRVKLVTVRDLGIEKTAAEDGLEEFETFVENAVAKARYFAQLTGMLTLADDSGLLVVALNGAPGVRTKRFAIDNGYAGPEVCGKPLDHANNRFLLEKLAGVERREAHYMSAVALVTESQLLSALGTCHGEITHAPRGSGGFGYDPVFYIPDLDKTFAELTRAEKNRRSHRGVAMRAIAPHLT
ncbi:MAG: non-canonical purine NTP pyrophosphatase [Gemmatimonadota bacterium]